MRASIIAFNNDQIGCYNYIDQKRYHTSITTGSETNTVNILDLSNTGDSSVSATLKISCTSIGASPNIVGHYNGHIIISITDGLASVVCSAITAVCSESEDLDVLVNINTSNNPPNIFCSLQGVSSYTIYWAIESSLSIIDGLADPYCPQPSTYIEGTTPIDENNDPSPSASPSNIIFPLVPQSSDNEFSNILENLETEEDEDPDTI